MALDKVTPGIASDETLLYGVEVKFYSNKVVVNSDFGNQRKRTACDRRRSICDERIAAGICKRNFRCKKYLKINGTIGLSIRLGKLG